MSDEKGTDRYAVDTVLWRPNVVSHSLEQWETLGNTRDILVVMTGARGRRGATTT